MLNCKENINGTGMKRAVLINDLSGFGKCSLTVAMPIISAYGAEAVCLPTAVLSTHTAGFQNFAVCDMTEYMKQFAEHWKSCDMKVDCIFSGFFGSAEQIDITIKFIEDFADENTLVVVDPVLGDNGVIYPCFNEEFVVKMRKLASMADIIVPNKTEACLLLDCDMDSPCEYLLENLKNENVIVTGERSGELVGYRARLGDKLVSIDKPYVDMYLHGTGDVFGSFLCGEILSGKEYSAALENAAELCDRCIKATAKRQPAHWYGLAFEDVLNDGKQL